MASGLHRGAAIAAAVLTVGLVGLAASSGNPVATEPYVPGRVLGGPAPTLEPLPTPTMPPPETGPPVWLRWLLDGFLWLCAAAIVVMLVVLTIRLFVGSGSALIRRRVMEPEEVAALAAPSTEIDLLGRGRELKDAVDQGMAALAEGTDVRAAIITAWLRLEEAASDAGTPRREDDAPGDLVGRLLTGHDVRPRRLETLAELYRQARFGPAPLTERDRDEAQRALADVRDDLLGRAPSTGYAGASPAPSSRASSGAPGEPDASGRWPTRWT